MAGILVASGIVTGRGRQIGISAALGLMAGFACGSWRAPDTVPPYTGPAEVVVQVRIDGDPSITARGSSVTATWNDFAGIARPAILLSPAGYTPLRGELVTAVATVQGEDGQRLVASQVRTDSAPAWPESWRHAARRWISDRVLGDMPGAEGSLALGLLIGDDSGFTAEQDAAVRAAGLSHITAVSGWNVTLVTSTLATFFAALGLQSRRWILSQMLAVSGFVWIVGPDPPVLRAAIMAGVVLAAHALGRPAHAVSMVTLTAALLVALDPGIIETLSFQLSVLATAALVIGLAHLPEWRGWRGVLLLPAFTTGVVGLATAPVLAGTTGTVSLAAIPANVLAAPLVELATAAGILLLVTPDVEALHVIASIPAWLLTHAILGVAHLASDLPWGHWQFARLSAAGGAALHVLILSVAIALLPETRVAAWDVARWTQRQPRQASFAATGLLLGATACVIVLP
jgi:ComEC/Rec2-related protein